jgi:TonB family protein
MKQLFFLCVALMLRMGVFAQSQRPNPSPNKFVIGRDTFFDFGPPFHYYDLFIVSAMSEGSSVIKISMTPPAGCEAPAKIEMASTKIQASVADLLLGNPCAIPEKALRREQKRCKKCLQFSGAEVAMQLQCGDATRIIRADILDRDWFAEKPDTPKYTSQTLQLTSRLDKVVGPGPMDQPIFHTEQEASTGLSKKIIPDSIIQDIRSGTYDSLFNGSKLKPSELYSLSLQQQTPPEIQLLSSTPVKPEIFSLPEYPAMARIAHIQGKVVARLDVDANGSVTTISFQTGHPVFQASVKDSLAKWKFPASAESRQVEVTVNFILKCIGTAESYLIGLIVLCLPRLAKIKVHAPSSHLCHQLFEYRSAHVGL